MAHLGLGPVVGVRPPAQLRGQALAVLRHPPQLLGGFQADIAQRTGQAPVGGVQLAAGVEEPVGGQADAPGIDRHEPARAAGRGRDERAALAGAALPGDQGRGQVLMPGRGREPPGHYPGDRLLLVGRRLAGVVEANQIVAELVEVTLPAAHRVPGGQPERTLERLRHHRRDAG